MEWKDYNWRKPNNNFDLVSEEFYMCCAEDIETGKRIYRQDQYVDTETNPFSEKYDGFLNGFQLDYKSSYKTIAYSKIDEYNKITSIILDPNFDGVFSKNIMEGRFFELPISYNGHNYFVIKEPIAIDGLTYIFDFRFYKSTTSTSYIEGNIIVTHYKTSNNNIKTLVREIKGPMHIEESEFALKYIFNDAFINSCSRVIEKKLIDEKKIKQNKKIMEEAISKLNKLKNDLKDLNE